MANNYIIKFSDVTAIQLSDNRFRYHYVCISEVEVLISEERAEQVTIQRYLGVHFDSHLE